MTTGAYVLCATFAKKQKERKERKKKCKNISPINMSQ